MIKSELIKKMAEENPDLLRDDIERVVNTIIEEISTAMEHGDRVELRGFGGFSTRTREARIARNPRTGAAVEVPEKKVPFFKVSKMLRERLNRKEAK